MTAHEWTAADYAADATAVRADYADSCAWCIPPAAAPVHRNGLCWAHWNEAHNDWDVD